MFQSLVRVFALISVCILATQHAGKAQHIIKNPIDDLNCNNSKKKYFAYECGENCIVKFIQNATLKIQSNPSYANTRLLEQIHEALMDIHVPASKKSPKTIFLIVNGTLNVSTNMYVLWKQYILTLQSIEFLPNVGNDLVHKSQSTISFKDLYNHIDIMVRLTCQIKQDMNGKGTLAVSLEQYKLGRFISSTIKFLETSYLKNVKSVYEAIRNRGNGNIFEK